MIWTAVLVASLGCLALKAAGWSLPRRWLEGPLLQRAALLLPVPLLAALVAVQALDDGEGGLAVDARLAGVAVAAVLLALRAPFLVVILAAAATAAGLRAL